MQHMNIDQIKTEIKDIILNDLDSNINPEDIRDDVSLYDDGLGLDSIAIINFIVLIEKKFDICFDELDINAQLFSSINSVAGYLEEKMKTKHEDLHA